jgi:hypothetical protein
VGVLANAVAAQAMSPSEARPHVVRPFGQRRGPVELFENYCQAFDYWRHMHHYDDPYVIVTQGRMISPETPVIDPNE